MIAATPLPRPRGLRNLPAEDQILFACTRRQLLDEHRRKLRELAGQNVNWQQLLSTALRHGVAPLVYAHLQQSDRLHSCMPTAVRAEFQQLSERSAVAKRLAAHRIRDILDFFRPHSIDVMLVKGAALDRVVYARPWHNMSGDVDLIMNCEKSKLSTAERKLAYDLLAGGSTALQCLVDVEGEWLTHHDITLNGILPVDFPAIWRRATTVDVLGRQALVMSPEDLFLAACINSCRKRYFRLKALYEIAELTRAFELDWTQVIDRSNRWNCGAIVYTALFTADLSLGCRMPGQLDGLAVGALRRRVIHYLSCHMSFSSLRDLQAGTNLLGKKIGPALLLPYATYGGHQTLAHLAVALGLWRRKRRKGLI